MIPCGIPQLWRSTLRPANEHDIQNCKIYLAGEKMSPCTQDELSSIWQKLKDGIEHDEDDWLIVTDTDVEQMLTRSTVAPYSDFDNGSTTVSYTRIRLNNEAPWGAWERKD